MTLDVWPEDKQDWEKVERQAKKGRRQIRRAMEEGNYRKAYKRALSALGSGSEAVLAVRKVLKEKGWGRPTPGIDGLTYESPHDKALLVHRLRTERRAAPEPLLAVSESRDDGTTREIYIPTLFDRARQTLLAQIIRALNDFRLSPGTFGTGRSRSIPQAYKVILDYLDDKPMSFLRIDIRRCFDDISRDFIVNAFMGPDKLRREVEALLGAEIGMGDSGLYPAQGAPQGMPLSPLLVNIALDALEPAMRMGLLSEPERAPLFIRYVDDILLLHPDADVLDDCYRGLDNALDELGQDLMLNPDKTFMGATEVPFGDTSIVCQSEGFTYLGWNLTQYPVADPYLPDSQDGADDEDELESYLTLTPKRGTYGKWVKPTVRQMIKTVKGRALVVDGYHYMGWDTYALARELERPEVEEEAAAEDETVEEPEDTAGDVSEM